MANVKLSQAKNAKSDEFYTQWADIEKEIQAYLDFNPDVFRGKTILCPCDDPEWSNFTKYFALRFKEYGIKKLISTSYAVESKTTKKAINQHYSRKMTQNSTSQKQGSMERYLYWTVKIPIKTAKSTLTI